MKKLRTRIGTLAATIVISLCSISPSAAQSPLPELIADRYDSSELLKRSIEAYRECIHYCVTKLEIRVEYTGVSVNVYIVPVIAHNNPDLLVMSTRTLGEGAYEDWEKVTSKIQAAIQQVELSTITGIPVEAFGGNTEYNDFGEHQSTTMQETQIIGNPAILVSQILGRDPYHAVSHETGDDNVGEYGSMIEKYRKIVQAAYSMNGAALAEAAMAYFDLQELVDMFKRASELAKIAAAVQAGNAGFGGASFQQDGYICKSEATVFWPYYLSSVDSIAWRSGYPFIDVTHTARFLSTDNQIRPSNESLLTDWGWIYPRSGFINSDHPARAAAVLTKRAAAVAGDANVVGRYRVQTPRSHIVQKMSPHPTDYCAANIADLDTSIEENDAYSYNLWIRYECSTSSRGVLAATIDIPDICIDP